jgi:hypothetical protein
MLSVASRYGTWNIRLQHYAVFSEILSSQNSVPKILAFKWAKEYFTHFLPVSWLSLLIRLSPTARPNHILKTDQDLLSKSFLNSEQNNCRDLLLLLAKQQQIFDYLYFIRP